MECGFIFLPLTVKKTPMNEKIPHFAFLVYNYYGGDEAQMKFKLIIDKSKEEEITVTAHERSELTDRLEAMVLEYGNEENIIGYADGQIKKLSLADIECVTVVDSKTYVIDVNGERWRIKKRLYELEAVLPSHFIRINKSTLANEKRLDRFTASFSGAVDAVFKCGYKEYVSRRCFSDIKRRFDSK